jgi:hypothetical protein
MRAADFFQYFALNGGAGEPAELAEECSYRALLPEVAIPGDVRSEIPLYP